MLPVGVLLLVAFLIRLLAFRSLLLTKQLEHTWERQRGTGDAIVIDVHQLDDHNYQRFTEAVRAADDFGAPVVARLPVGLTLPRAWAALACNTPLLALSLSADTAKSAGRCD